MKKLSRNEMKSLMGGDAPTGGCPTGYTFARVVCKDGCVIDSPNKCANSSNLCNGCGGFQGCYCFN